MEGRLLCAALQKIGVAGGGDGDRAIPSMADVPTGFLEMAAIVSVRVLLEFVRFLLEIASCFKLVSRACSSHFVLWSGSVPS